MFEIGIVKAKTVLTFNVNPQEKYIVNNRVDQFVFKF